MSRFEFLPKNYLVAVLGKSLKCLSPSFLLCFLVMRTPVLEVCCNDPRCHLGGTPYSSDTFMGSRKCNFPSLPSPSLTLHYHYPQFPLKLLSWRRKWQPTPVFLPGASRGQRNLVGYSPWARKESDMTERLTLSLFK